MIVRKRANHFLYSVKKIKLSTYSKDYEKYKKKSLRKMSKKKHAEGFIYWYEYVLKDWIYIHKLQDINYTNNYKLIHKINRKCDMFDIVRSYEG